MYLGATTQDASLGHLDHPPNGRLKANYSNVVPTVVARAWYSETTRVPAEVRGCTGNFAGNTPGSPGPRATDTKRRIYTLRQTENFSCPVQVSEIEYESKKEMLSILQIFIIARAAVHHRY